jgi:hypothetical protein
VQKENTFGPELLEDLPVGGELEHFNRLPDRASHVSRHNGG